MENKMIKDLKARLAQEDSNITLGDVSATTLLKLHGKKDTALEDVLIGLFNMAKINQSKINNLEINLNSLSSRVFDTETNFTTTEIEEITKSFQGFDDFEELSKLDNFKEYLQDGLYCDVDDIDDDNEYELRENKRKELFNKIQYPTQKMDKTFKELVNIEIGYEIEHKNELKNMDN